MEKRYVSREQMRGPWLCGDELSTGWIARTEADAQGKSDEKGSQGRSPVRDRWDACCKDLRSWYVFPEGEKGLWLCGDELFVRLDTYITRI
jgi:hypothetical protein